MVDPTQDATATAAERAPEDIDIVATYAAKRLSSICGRTITAEKIRKWASRGRVKQTGRRGAAMLYSMNELQAYADSLYGTS